MRGCVARRRTMRKIRPRWGSRMSSAWPRASRVHWTRAVNPARSGASSPPLSQQPIGLFAADPLQLAARRLLLVGEVTGDDLRAIHEFRRRAELVELLRRENHDRISVRVNDGDRFTTSAREYLPHLGLVDGNVPEFHTASLGAPRAVCKPGTAEWIHCVSDTVLASP